MFAGSNIAQFKLTYVGTIVQLSERLINVSFVRVQRLDHACDGIDCYEKPHGL